MGAHQALGTLSPEKDKALSLGTGSLNCGWSCTTCLSLVWQCPKCEVAVLQCSAQQLFHVLSSEETTAFKPGQAVLPPALVPFPGHDGGQVYGRALLH